MAERVDGYRQDGATPWPPGYALRVVGDGKCMADHDYHYAQGRLVIYRNHPRRLTVITGDRATHWRRDAGLVLREICT